tara:strand:- start:28296 stop:29966 length:1671 start_codon:yes stop_codon:yes gene_type:complete
MAVLLKRAVFGLHEGMFGLGRWIGGAWVLGLGPLFGLLATRYVIRKWLGGEHPGPGVPSILHAMSQRRGRIKRMWMFSPLITSALSVGLGGSGGLEAPALQSAAAVGSEIGRQTKRTFKRRMLLIGCAAAASLAALFKAPVAAIIFAVEVIMIDLTGASLVPLLLASLTALITAELFLGNQDVLSTPVLQDFELNRLPLYLLLGIVCAVGSVVFSKIYMASSHAVAKMRTPRIRIWVAGTLVGAAVVFFPSLYGEGYDVVNDLFGGHSKLLASDMTWSQLDPEGWSLIGLLLLAWILKPMLTGMTVGAGGVAGIFAPAIFCGALLGYVYTLGLEQVFGNDTLPVGNAVLAGIGGMLAGVLHAPLTAILLAAEVSGGYALFVPVMLTSAISFQVAKWWVKHSIYTQELAERGELLTHDKDHSVLTLMKLQDEIEYDHEVVQPYWTLGQLIPVIERSVHSLFPVLDKAGNLLGVVDLQEIREIMFDRTLYDELHVHEFMSLPQAMLDISTKMERVMSEFERTELWYLPVQNKGNFIGFVSRTRLFNTYRKWLQESSLN